MTYWIERLRVNRADNAIMTYFAVHDQKLIGTSSIVCTNSPKTRHSATIVGMYVQPDWWVFILPKNSYRPVWIGRALRRPRLSTRCDRHEYGCDSAATLAVVFKFMGSKPQALYYDGVFYDELLMARTT